MFLGQHFMDYWVPGAGPDYFVSFFFFFERRADYFLSTF